MIRRKYYPQHPHKLQVYDAYLTCLKRFHSADILQLLFSSQNQTITICLCSCHPISSVLLCPCDLLITWAGEDLGEIWGVYFSPNIYDFGSNEHSFPELTEN